MKKLGLNIDTKKVKHILFSTLLGGMVGLAIALWRDNNIAVFLCAISAGTVSYFRLRDPKTKNPLNQA